ATTPAAPVGPAGGTAPPAAASPGAVVAGGGDGAAAVGPADTTSPGPEPGRGDPGKPKRGKARTEKTAMQDIGSGDADLADDADARPAPPDATSPSQAPASSRATFSWHAVKAKASTQLKAFLQPAQASLEDDEIRVVYQDTHAFHYRQLLQRRDELE